MITLVANRSEEAAVALVERAFAADGPLALELRRLDRPARLEPAQLGYARMVARALARGAVLPGRVSFIEGEAGIGKTLGLMIPLAAHAVATGRPALLSTYRVHLQLQALAGDAPLAAAVVERLTGRRPRIAARHGRRNFFSQQRIAAARKLPGLDAAARQELDELWQWVARANDPAAPPECTGLIEHWLLDRGGRLPAGFRAEGLALTAHDEPESQIAYRRHRGASAEADVLLVSHALAAIDVAHWFAVLKDRSGGGFSAVVFDEADQLPQAARAAAEPRVALSTLRGLCGDALDAVAGLAPADQAPVAAAAAALDAAMTVLEAAVEDLAATLDEPPDGAALAVRLRPAGGQELHGRTAGALERVAVEVELLRAALAESAGEEAALAAAEVAGCHQAIGGMVRDLSRPGADGAEVAIEWSPRRHLPSLRRVVTAPGRLFARLWYADVERVITPRADAVIFTSATLGVPGVRPEARFGWLGRQLGVADRVVNADLSGCWAPARYGRAAFMLPHPAMPLPSDAEGRSSPEWLDAAALMTATAHHAGGRVLVLTLSHGDSAGIAERLGGYGVAGSAVLLHRAGGSLRDLVRRFAWLGNAPVLLSAGGWSGLDLPGLVDHLVISRLPFPPSDPAAVGENGMAERVTAMLMTLRQGLGRPFRGPSDAATIWFADPRIGLPEDVADREGLTPHPRSRPLYLTAIPRRFAPALDEAQVFSGTGVVGGRARRPLRRAVR